MNTTFVCRIAVCAVALHGMAACACTGMYAGRKVSADGTVLIGRTVDTPPWSCCFRAVRVPRGEGVKYAYVCTPAVTALGKGFFPSACANEAGLVISGTVTGHTRPEILALDPNSKTNANGVGERNLPGLVAANCATAREALDYFAKAIAERGHLGAEIYMFADRDEAWYLEVYTGHQWAAVRTREGTDPACRVGFERDCGVFGEIDHCGDPACCCG